MTSRPSQSIFKACSAGADARPHGAALVADLLASADVQVGGSRPWDIRVHRPRFFGRVLRAWSLGLGESYVDGDWDCDQLDDLFTRLLRTDIETQAVGWARLRLLVAHLRHRWANLQSPERAFQVGEHHYDAGNDIFEAMLDSRMVYSCAYWERAQDLEQAQHDKLDLICRKLQLQRGESLLDIGCGWGGLAAFAAERYGVSVTGVTVSKEQLALAQARCAGLPVNLMLQDYRALQGRFDKIVSVGMFEHVGPRNYATYFGSAQRLLAGDGLFLLHTIGLDRASGATDPWIDKYVFPNGKLPSAAEVAAALEGRFVVEDWHNFGPDYDRTLMAWHQRFEQAWPRLQAGYDERFHRLWRYYLLCCAGFFRARQGQLWQLVLSHRPRTEVYRSVRLATGA
jgi:cyclopropane-fatty-acyl-phospholipid synthase